MPIELDHIGVSDVDRTLIHRAANQSSRVYLAPMDKGLSGSSVWQARWQLESGSSSRLSVFKIGHIEKLQNEFAAMKHVAAAIEIGRAHV